MSISLPLARTASAILRENTRRRPESSEQKVKRSQVERREEVASMSIVCPGGSRLFRLEINNY